MLATVAARPALKAITRQQARQFSMMHNLRQFARSFEPHPFQRLPVTASPAKADWGKLVKRSSKQAVVYFPLAFAILGWPWVTAQMLDGHM
ncbi:hypothetical protein N0V88_002448 [Collariella sp. IMI 366227]|nr:hypothetical protein N0V88_002448 [Collariella sp. IMI 366227]